jgi:hypothetical protein
MKRIRFFLATSALVFSLLFLTGCEAMRNPAFVNSLSQSLNRSNQQMYMQQQQQQQINNDRYFQMQMQQNQFQHDNMLMDRAIRGY